MPSFVDDLAGVSVEDFRAELSFLVRALVNVFISIEVRTRYRIDVLSKIPWDHVREDFGNQSSSQSMYDQMSEVLKLRRTRPDTAAAVAVLVLK